MNQFYCILGVLKGKASGSISTGIGRVPSSSIGKNQNLDS